MEHTKYKYLKAEKLQLGSNQFFGSFLRHSLEHFGVDEIDENIHPNSSTTQRSMLLASRYLQS